MRIAVIGAGVAGLYSAWHLAQSHEVVLYEQNGRVGGHTDTHTIETAEGALAVDSGFIIFNPDRYPLFSAWINQFGVASRATEMSFGVSCQKTGLEYNASTLNGLFCQRSNLFRARFLGMVRDILNFYKHAPALLEQLDDDISLGQWLKQADSGAAFAQDHLIPMTSALWSTPPGQVLEFPMRYLLEFMHNHMMLQASNRPTWRTVLGGSQQYVRRALDSYQGQLRLSSPVNHLSRRQGQVMVSSNGGQEAYDQVVLACHADQALALLEQPSPEERQVLSAFEYSNNDTVLHTDISLMPRNRNAWASWNVRKGSDQNAQQGAISYWMNSLQGLPGATQYIVSLNQTDQIDPAKILKRRHYQHPLYTRRSRQAQSQLNLINGHDRIWYCGAHWGWGFHEDAVRSAAAVIDGMNTLKHAA